ncbi:hypothetical protein M0802_009448 [Mischocyttarus mexicanus]|nr:hypothetical protein M0802_009448 [Mischocyttarus mexicanus]
MSVKIDSEIRNGRSYITSCSKLPVKNVSGIWKPEKGIILKVGTKFEVQNNFPQINSKIYCALCDVGLKELVDKVLETKTGSLVNINYIWDTVRKYSYRTPVSSGLDSYHKALQALEKSILVNKKLEPLTIEEAAQEIPLHDSAGFPYILTHKKHSNKDIINNHFNELKTQWVNIAKRNSVVLPDCAAMATSKICSADVNEVSPAWIMPISIVLQEARFAVPLLRALKEQECCKNAAFGCEIMKGGMMWLNKEIALCNERFGPIKTLIPKYDDFNACVPSWLIRDVFQIVFDKFNMTPEDEIMFKEYLTYFIHTPIRDPKGRRFLKTHGIPTGLMFTDIIGTFVNMVVTWCTCLSMCKEFPLLDLFYSDNSIICYHEKDELILRRYAKFIKNVFGLSINLEQSYWTSNIEKIYLHGYYNHNGVPHKDIEEIIAMMLYTLEVNNREETWEEVVSKSLDCLITSVGCSPNIFKTCRAIVLLAFRGCADIDEAIQMTRTKARSLRHQVTLGFQDLDITSEYFINFNLAIPTPTCAKFKLHLTV